MDSNDVPVVCTHAELRARGARADMTRMHRQTWPTGAVASRAGARYCDSWMLSAMAHRSRLRR